MVRRQFEVGDFDLGGQKGCFGQVFELLGAVEYRGLKLGEQQEKLLSVCNVMDFFMVFGSVLPLPGDNLGHETEPCFDQNLVGP